MAAGVADGGGVDAASCQNSLLGAPEAAQPEDRLLEPSGNGGCERRALDEMGVRHGHALLRPGSASSAAGIAVLSLKKSIAVRKQPARPAALRFVYSKLSRAGAPCCCSASGTSSPWFSTIAMIVRPTATAVPLSVWRWRVPLPSPRPVAHVQAAGLEVRGVGARGELAVAALPRQPGLEVVFLRGRGAKVVHRDVHDAVGDLERLQQPLLDREQPLVLLRRLPRLDEREHLDLVELVHAEDAAGVLARGAGLAAEAGGEAGVAERQLAPSQDLAAVQRRQRHLGGAGEVEVVVGHAVDLLLGVGQESRAVERLLADQHGRHHGHEPVRLQLGHRPADERQLEQDERALEVCEARSGHACARLQIHEPVEQLEVVRALAAGLPDLAQDLVLRRRRPVGQVGQRGERGVEALLHLAQLLVEGLLAIGALANRRDRLGGVLARALELTDPLAGLVLLGPQLLDLGQQRPPPFVQLERGVEGIGRAAAGQCGSCRVRVAPDLLEVEHRRRGPR